MCLILSTNKPGRIQDVVIRNVLENNPDGVGALWYDTDGILQAKKRLTSDADEGLDFYRKCAREAESAKSQLAVHFRKRTTGGVTLDNVQPVKAGRLMMMHNGTIEGFRPKEAELDSDSVIAGRFIGNFEAELGTRAITSQPFIQLLGMAASGSRILLAQPERSPFILVNPGLWTFISGHAFSNLYAWNSFALTRGRYGTKESEERLARRNRALNRF
ncbi:hypothetical protein ACJU26_08975 [Acidithiobacillus sp. M4-SHS-6]|uniref:hypothetical protein n=1 Tax=Acidithiobacillus sp. M4-SHS-6 TaxID=3383024 RepID=UPI0039BE4782